MYGKLANNFRPPLAGHIPFFTFFSLNVRSDPNVYTLVFVFL